MNCRVQQNTTKKKGKKKREMWRNVADAVRTLRENIEVVEVDARTMMMLDDDDDDSDDDVVVAGLVASSSSSPNRLVVHHQGENSTLTMSVDDDGNATIGNDFEET